MLYDFIEVGGGHALASNRIILIASPTRLSGFKLRSRYRKLGRVIDLRSGKKMRSMILLDTEIMVLSRLKPYQVVMRLTKDTATKKKIMDTIKKQVEMGELTWDHGVQE